MPRITDFSSCIYVLGCKLSLVRLCDSDFGINFDLLLLLLLLLFTATDLSLGGSSPYTSTDKTDKNKYT